MSGDAEIDSWLSSLGYAGSEARTEARAVLEAAQLTRAGKQRLSTAKLEGAQAALAAQLFRTCGQPDCDAFAARSGRKPVRVDPRTTCERCGGSDNLRAVTALLEACRAQSLGHVVIVGGSPSTREELVRLIGDKLEVRLVDGTERRPIERAKADLDWAELVLLWGASELHHKVSMQYTNAPLPQRKKVLHVAKRGIAQLLSEALAWVTNHRRT